MNNPNEVLAAILVTFTQAVQQDGRIYLDVIGIHVHQAIKLLDCYKSFGVISRFIWNGGGGKHGFLCY